MYSLLLSQVEKERMRENAEKQRSPSRQQFLYNKDMPGRKAFLESQRHKSPLERFGRRLTSSQEIGWLVEESLRAQREESKQSRQQLQNDKQGERKTHFDKLNQSLIEQLKKDKKDVTSKYGRKKVWFYLAHSHAS